MKANAPKKIYFDGESKACKLPVFSSYNIEYTRTDAFIEKACEWLRDNYLKYPNEDCADTTKFVMDFRKYMEGE